MHPPPVSTPRRVQQLGMGTSGGASPGGGQTAALGSSLEGVCKIQLYLRGSLMLRDQLLSPGTGDNNNGMSPLLHPAAICQIHPGQGMFFHLTSPGGSPPYPPGER